MSSLHLATVRDTARVAVIRRQPIAVASAARRGLPRWLRRCAGPLLLLLLWHVASVSGLLPVEILAGPGTVLSSASALWASGELPEAIAVSLRRASLGLLIGG